MSGGYKTASGRVARGADYSLAKSYQLVVDQETPPDADHPLAIPGSVVELGDKSTLRVVVTVEGAEFDEAGDGDSFGSVAGILRIQTSPDGVNGWTYTMSGATNAAGIYFQAPDSLPALPESTRTIHAGLDRFVRVVATDASSDVYDPDYDGTPSFTFSVTAEAV